MRTLYHVATWRGTPLRLHYSWLSVALLGAAVLIGYTLPSALPELGRLGRFALALLIVALALLVVIVHEAAHLLVARALGVAVPAVNLYPLGALTRLPDRNGSSKAAFWVAAAGPVTSLALWLFLVLVLAIVAVPAWLALMLGITARASLVLGLVNLLPGLPFDGGRMLRAVFWSLGGTFENASALAARLGQAIGYGLLLVGAILVIGRQDWLNGGIVLLIGWGALDAIGALHRRAVVARLLNKLTAADVLRPPTRTLPSSTTLRDAWQALRSQAHGTPMPVVDGEQFVGTVTNEQLLDVPQGYWDTRTLAEALTPADTLDPVSPDTPMTMLLPRLANTDVLATAVVPVVEEGRLLGLVAAREMAEFLELDDTFGLLPRVSPGQPFVAEPPHAVPVRQTSPASGAASRT
jgi:Zn-dependent protease